MNLFQRKKNKFPTMTLEDFVKHYKKNPQYRYAVVVGKINYQGRSARLWKVQKMI